MPVWPAIPQRLGTGRERRKGGDAGEYEKLDEVLDKSEKEEEEVRFQARPGSKNKRRRTWRRRRGLCHRSYLRQPRRRRENRLRMMGSGHGRPERGGAAQPSEDTATENMSLVGWAVYLDLLFYALIIAITAM